mgnify:CR=1 FL=1
MEIKKSTSLTGHSSQGRLWSILYTLLLLFTFLLCSCEKNECEESRIIPFKDTYAIPYGNDSVLTYTFRKLDWWWPDSSAWGPPDTVLLKRYQGETIFTRAGYDDLCPIYSEGYFFDYGGANSTFIKTYITQGKASQEKAQVSLSIWNGDVLWKLEPTEYPQINEDSSYTFQLFDNSEVRYKRDSGFIKLVSKHHIIQRIK